MQSKLIVGTVIGFSLLGLLITDKTPGWVEAAFGIFFFLTVAGLVAFLMTRGSGWHALAKQYPERTAYTGKLRRCRQSRWRPWILINASARASPAE